MSDLGELRELIEPEVKAMGFDLVRVAWVKGEGDEPTLQVMAERRDTRQLVMDDCVSLSRRISDRFDALEEQGSDPIDHAYRLEVSSPGIDRPLTRIKDYADWQGHEAKIEMIEAIAGQKRFRGTLRGVEQEGEIVTIEDRQGVFHNLSFGDIDNAKLVLTDRLIAATVPLDIEGAEEVENSYDDEIDKEEQD